MFNFFKKAATKKPSQIVTILSDIFAHSSKKCSGYVHETQKYFVLNLKIDNNFQQVLLAKPSELTDFKYVACTSDSLVAQSSSLFRTLMLIVQSF